MSLDMDAVLDLFAGSLIGFCTSEIESKFTTHCPLAYSVLDLFAQLNILAEELLGILPPLTEADVIIGEEGATFGDDIHGCAKINYVALFRNPFIVHDVKFRRTEGWRDLVFHHANPRAVAHDLRSELDGLDAPGIKTHRSIKFKCQTARRGLGITEHDSILLA